MPADQRRKQKKTERRTAKRKEKKQAVARAQGGGLAEVLTLAAHLPPLHCWIGKSLEPEGIGWVVFSRELPGGQVAAASFLVDRYCLGVKNVHAEVVSRGVYDIKYARKMATDVPSRAVQPTEARKLLEDAVAYARSFGLAPHPEYARALLLFGGIDPSESSATWEFGKDGKPFFLNGPHDTPERCREILAALHAKCGPGNYDYMLQIDGPLRDATPETLQRILPAGGARSAEA